MKSWPGQSAETRQYIADYLGMEEVTKDTPPSRYANAILRAGMASVADTFIAQMQDYLAIGSEGRMNEPGIVGTNNWSWRLPQERLTEELSQKIRTLTKRYER